jgi:hypothetical protein
MQVNIVLQLESHEVHETPEKHIASSEFTDSVVAVTASCVALAKAIHGAAFPETKEASLIQDRIICGLKCTTNPKSCEFECKIEW